MDSLNSAADNVTFELSVAQPPDKGNAEIGEKTVSREIVLFIYSTY